MIVLYKASATRVENKGGLPIADARLAHSFLQKESMFNVQNLTHDWFAKLLCLLLLELSSQRRISNA